MGEKIIFMYVSKIETWKTLRTCICIDDILYVSTTITTTNFQFKLNKNPKVTQA